MNISYNEKADLLYIRLDDRKQVRYIEYAKELLGKSAIEGRRYVDIKYVKSACGAAYLGVLKAIDEYLLRRGIGKKELPKKVEEYEKALKRYATPYNGKVLSAFNDINDIYDELHIAGYYRGMLHSVETVKGALKTAEDFINKLDENENQSLRHREKI